MTQECRVLVCNRRGVGLKVELGIHGPRKKLRVCLGRPLRPANQGDSWAAWRQGDFLKEGKCLVVRWGERISNHDDLASTAESLTCCSPDEAGMTTFSRFFEDRWDDAAFHRIDFAPRTGPLSPRDEGFLERNDHVILRLRLPAATANSPVR